MIIDFLACPVRGVHWTIGIRPLRRERNAFYVFLWIGILAMFAAGFVLLMHLLYEFAMRSR